MVASLQVYGGDGKIQLDTDLMTQRLIKSQTITIQKSFWGNANAKTTVTVRGKFPVLFFADALNATGYAHNNYRVDRVTSVGTGETKTWTFYLNVGGPALPSITSYTFRIYIFDSRPEARTNFGIETFGEDGKLTFSSFTPPMNITHSAKFPEYIFSYQFNCTYFLRIDGLHLNNCAVASNIYRDGYYAATTTTQYIDIAQEYVSFSNLIFPQTEAVTGVSMGLYTTGETINDFGAIDGATCFTIGTPTVTVIDTTNIPMPFG